MLVLIKIWLSLAVRMTAFSVVLLWPAGTWRWWEAWVVIGLWAAWGIAIIIQLSRHDPELLSERLKTKLIQKEQKSWDKILILLIFFTGLGIYIIPGFDVVRFGWSEPLPIWIKVIAMAVHLPGFLFLSWVMMTNTYLSPVVKIDRDRNHHVITNGPYAIVRHPMYTVVIILVFAVPLALGSRFALIPSILMALIFIVRTYLEDRTLHVELPGYPDYANNTRYRLIPRIW